MKSPRSLILFLSSLLQSGCLILPWVKVIPLGDVTPKNVIVQNQRSEPVEFIWKDATGQFAMVATIPPERTVKFKILKTEPGNDEHYLNWYEYSVSARGLISGTHIPGRVDVPLPSSSRYWHDVMNPWTGNFWFVVTDESVFLIFYPVDMDKVKSRIQTLNPDISP